MTNQEFSDQIMRAIKYFSTCELEGHIVALQFKHLHYRKADKYYSFIQRFIAKHREGEND